MATKNSKSILITGLTDKRNVTLTFTVSLSGEFLLLQIIYGGKTKASLPHRFEFPKGFCLTQNSKHWSNEQETMKLIKEIINPYIVKTRSRLELSEAQWALVVWDVFKGQVTDKVKQMLTSLYI